MGTDTTIEEDADLLVATCPVKLSERHKLLESRLSVAGRPRFRVKGVAMAWCDSVAEAFRVAHILIRAGRADELEADIFGRAA